MYIFQAMKSDSYHLLSVCTSDIQFGKHVKDGKEDFFKNLDYGKILIVSADGFSGCEFAIDYTYFDEAFNQSEQTLKV